MAQTEPDSERSPSDNKASHSVELATSPLGQAITAESSQPLNGADLVSPQSTVDFNASDALMDDAIVYKVYKRRFLGLTQLVFLNLIVSWNWLSFAASSSTVATYFDTSQATVNWLSTAFLFAFVAISPAVSWVLNKGGPKPAMMIASASILVGNWIRYAGTRSGPHGNFGVVMFGQILIGFAQPFVLCAPTRYSDLWFTDKGRISATAIASLANPLGGALGQLVDPAFVTSPSQVPNMVLYVAIISTATTQFSYFLPSKPPTPPCASAAATKTPFLEGFPLLRNNWSFWIIFTVFSVYVGFFNATSSLINQIFEPYGFSEDAAGVAGGLLIIVGLIASAIVSPIIDRTKWYLTTIKVLIPLVAACYVILIWMPGTRGFAGPYIICALLGATSFSLLPVALEYLVEVTYPVSPETSSTLCWTGGQLLGAIFIIIMTAMEGIRSDEAPGSLIPGLIFQAVIAVAVAPFVFLMGTRLVKRHAKGRLELERPRPEP